MNSTLLVGVCLDDDQALELEAFAQACGTAPETVVLLVEEGLLSPAVESPAWRFGGEELARARRILRLQRDFEANLDAVAVMLELMDEIDRLRGVLRRAGIPAP